MILRLTETQAAYLAGLIDGEGCIFIDRQERSNRRSPTFHLLLRIDTTSKAIDTWLRTFVGCSFHLKPRPTTSTHRRICYLWLVRGDEAADVLEQVLPYLILKAPLARTGIEFRAWQKEHRVAYPQGGRSQAVTEKLDAFRKAIQQGRYWDAEIHPLIAWEEIK